VWGGIKNRGVYNMKKIQSKKIKNGVVELYRTKKGFSIQRWIYYDKSKNTEMRLQSKLSFSREQEELALDAYYEIVIKEGVYNE
jgi:hypothetical protein